MLKKLIQKYSELKTTDGYKARYNLKNSNKTNETKKRKKREMGIQGRRLKTKKRIKWRRRWRRIREWRKKGRRKMRRRETPINSNKKLKDSFLKRGFDLEKMNTCQSSLYISQFQSWLELEIYWDLKLQGIVMSKTKNKDTKTDDCLWNWP